MTVVSESSPLSALAEIGELELLQRLFGSIVLPTVVLSECDHQRAPAALRKWASALPDWVTVTPPPAVLPAAASALDPGEAAAIAIAANVSGPVLLVIDERNGVTVARHLGLPFVGTLGLLVKAHRLRFVDFESALAALLETRFRVSASVVALARSLLA